MKKYVLSIVLILGLLTLSNQVKSQHIVKGQFTIYKPHPQFKEIMTNRKYACYGKPAEKYRVHKCQKCSKPYYTQAFKKDGVVTEIFYYSGFKCTDGGNHMATKPASVCDCFTGVQNKEEYINE